MIEDPFIISDGLNLFIGDSETPILNPKIIIDKIKSKCNQIEKEILFLNLGLEFDSISLYELSHILFNDDLSIEEVRQIRNKALEKLGFNTISIAFITKHIDI